MKRLSIEEMVKITKGKLVQGDPQITVSKFSTDSRTLKRGQFFIPIQGDNYDGHDFISQAISKGAVGFFVEHRVLPSVRKKLAKLTPRVRNRLQVIAIPNTRLALGAVASRWLEYFKSIKVVAITGSNGKTTTKEIIANILSRRYRIHYTQGNMNNDIGVPLTVFSLPEKTQVLIIELGVNHFYELEHLAKIVRPNVTVITNVGETHLEYLRDIQGVARAKAEIIPFTKDLLILNADDRFVTFFQSHARCSTRLVGNEGDKVFEAIDRLGPSGYKIRYKKLWADFRLLGEYNLRNAAMATAVAEFFNISGKLVVEALTEMKPLKGRTRLYSGKIKILSDTYNANPTSVIESMRLLKDLAGNNRKIAVIGSMKELGIKTQQLHREIGYFAEQYEYDALFCVGAETLDIPKGMKSRAVAVKHHDRKKNLYKALRSYLKPGDFVLVKGSRVMEMEDVVKELKSWKK